MKRSSELRASVAARSAALLKDFALGPDGSSYACSSYYITRIFPCGQQTILAGRGQSPDVDGGPAQQASKVFCTAIAVDPQGVIYFADSLGRVRRIDQAGILTRL